MDRIITDNSKVNENLLNEVKALKKQNKELIVENIGLKEQLHIGGVSQQRELLAFLDWVSKNTPSYSVQKPKQIVQSYLKANCG